MEQEIEMHPCPGCDCFTKDMWCEDCVDSSFTDADLGGEGGV